MCASASPELVQIAQSPWSERARWALEHHGIPYRTSHFVPMFGAPALRWRLGNFSAKTVTVPVLFIPNSPPVTDSVDIAHWADAHAPGKTAALFPAGCEADIGAWLDEANKMMDVGRAIALARLKADNKAKLSIKPRLWPPWLKIWLVDLSLGYFFRKYALDAQTREANEAVLRDGCLRIRAGLAKTGGKYLVAPPGEPPRFTFADIAMAAPLNSIKPGDDAFIKVEPEVRVIRTIPHLAAEFADVLAWRDGLYEAHRPSRRTTAAFHAAAGVR